MCVTRLVYNATRERTGPCPFSHPNSIRTMNDPHHLQRFVDAQAPVYTQVKSELARGAKTSHWMWFVFPQLKGLGRSSTALHYGIASIDEAQAYMRHPVLGPRLTECTELVLAVS